MKRLWQVLLQLAEGEKGEPLSCDDCFRLLDYLADLLAEGYAAAEIMPLAGKYLRRCPGCQEEYLQALTELSLELARRAPAGQSATGPPSTAVAAPRS